MTINENRLMEIIQEGIRDAIHNAVINNGYREGKPEKLADVITGNQWKVYQILKKDRFEIIFTVVKNGNIPTERFIQSYDSGGALPFEDLIEDINIYFQDKGKRFKAEPYEAGMERGAGIRIFKY